MFKDMTLPRQIDRPGMVGVRFPQGLFYTKGEFYMGQIGPSCRLPDATPGGR